MTLVNSRVNKVIYYSLQTFI